MLNMSGKKEYFYIVHSVKTKAASFTPLTIMLVKRFFLTLFIKLRKFFSILSLLLLLLLSRFSRVRLCATP